MSLKFDSWIFRPQRQFQASDAKPEGDCSIAPSALHVDHLDTRVLTPPIFGGRCLPTLGEPYRR